MNTISEDANPRHTAINESKIEEGKIPEDFLTNDTPVSQRWRGLGTNNNHDKHVGLAHAAVSAPSRSSLEDDEKRVTNKIARKWRLTHFLQTNVSGLVVLFYYLVTLETIISVGLTIGLTIFWHRKHADSTDFDGGTIDFFFIGFAVITPITVSLGLAFGRREQALYEIRRIRTCCFQIYNAHAIWNWKGSDPESSGRVEAGINWLHHSDKVLEQLIGIGDELCRFLTLPTSSRSYHRTMSCGRKEAADIVEVAYRLFDSLYTQRLTQLSFLNEKFKTLGVSHSEVSRLRQYERYIGESMEALRMIKMYRTPQALRAFGRIFTLIIPPFYAPRFAQVAFDLDSLALGICFATITPFALTALYESTQILEDPFVGYVSLDGIDVTEEFEVLHWHQLINSRKVLYPHAEDFHETSGVPIDTWQPKEEKAVGLEKKSLGGSSRSSRYVLGGAGLEAITGREITT
mmetsp:Transcript_10356/g.12154  ORF Transcript_10356/g.12154 Transcript_10356/m.12154 type:complete len:461 (-) Transcript_10356:53-1435(-)